MKMGGKSLIPFPSGSSTV